MEESIHHPKWAFPKSKEEIFRELLQDARRYWPDLPDNLDRMDPILRMFFGAFASQFENLYSSLQKTTEEIFEAMARHMYYDVLLYPIPAVTVLRFDPTDEGIEVDEFTSVIYTEERGKERRTFHFTPCARLPLVRANPSKVFLLSSSGISNLSPRIFEKGNPQSENLSRDLCEKWGEGHLILYLGLKPREGTKELSRFNLFVVAPEKTLSLLRWGIWIPSSREGSFLREKGEIPGKASFETTWQVKNLPLFPHFRGSKDFLSEFENQLFSLTDLSTSPLPEELRQLLGNTQFLDLTEEFAWIKVILPKEATEGTLLEIQEIHTNCIPATNLWHQVLNHVTQGLPLVEITLPDPFEKLYRIEEVRDSDGRIYENRLTAEDLRSPYLYSLREEGERPCIVLQYGREERVPDRIQITYTITEAEEANGIEPGLLTELYDKRQHPGIETVTNITRSRGGQSAPSKEDLLRGFTHLLRTHSRAITTRDLEDLIYSFDPRIQKVTSEQGVDRGPNGAVKCIYIQISLKESAFSTHGERELFQNRLQSYLKERSPVNTVIRLILN